MRVAIFSDAGSAMGGCRSCRPYGGIDFGDFGAMTWEEFITANPQCAGKRPATYAVQGFEAEGDPLPYMDSACQKAWEAAGSPLPSTPAGYTYKSGIVDPDDPKTSATAQGVNPAPNGDTWAVLVNNYSKERIINAIAWAWVEVPTPEATAANYQVAQSTYQLAVNGDLEARKRATRSMAYYYAEGGRYAAPGETAPSKGATQAVIDAAKKRCMSLPTGPGIDYRSQCLSLVDKTADAGEKAIDDALSKIPGLPPPPPEVEEAKSIPWWAWVAGAGAAALIVKVVIKGKRG